MMATTTHSHPGIGTYGSRSATNASVIRLQSLAFVTQRTLPIAHCFVLSWTDLETCGRLADA